MQHKNIEIPQNSQDALQEKGIGSPIQSAKSYPQTPDEEILRKGPPNIKKSREEVIRNARAAKSRNLDTRVCRKLNF